MWLCLPAVNGQLSDKNVEDKHGLIGHRRDGHTESLIWLQWRHRTRIGHLRVGRGSLEVGQPMSAIARRVSLTCHDGPVLVRLRLP